MDAWLPCGVWPARKFHDRHRFVLTLRSTPVTPQGHGPRLVRHTAGPARRQRHGGAARGAAAQEQSSGRAQLGLERRGGDDRRRRFGHARRRRRRGGSGAWRFLHNVWCAREASFCCRNPGRSSGGSHRSWGSLDDAVSMRTCRRAADPMPVRAVHGHLLLLCSGPRIPSACKTLGHSTLARDWPNRWLPRALLAKSCPKEPPRQFRRSIRALVPFGLRSRMRGSSSRP